MCTSCCEKETLGKLKPNPCWKTNPHAHHCCLYIEKKTPQIYSLHGARLLTKTNVVPPSLNIEEETDSKRFTPHPQSKRWRLTFTTIEKPSVSTKRATSTYGEPASRLCTFIQLQGSGRGFLR